VESGAKEEVRQVESTAKKGEGEYRASSHRMGRGISQRNSNVGGEREGGGNAPAEEGFSSSQKGGKSKIPLIIEIATSWFLKLDDGRADRTPLGGGRNKKTTSTFSRTDARGRSR